ncbi:MAG: hypothetical protein A3G81_14405 [Betaproteobacteria bacterium RIFCSPLOWO2_12_FULL_65_14]|nr:MAG: hypothetical protein A3G81_14405 [Betaproteobacteria bacterium RIFCSPLOWO2_12_FULL_65_14]
MYLLDPEQGRRRRALLRDQLVHAKRVLSERAGSKARDLSNRAQGLAAEARRIPEGARHLGR